MTTKIYGTRIKWQGGERPVPPDTTVKVKLRRGNSMERAAADLYWSHDGDGSDIVEYRIITEQPDLEAAEKLLRENGYTVTPPAKPLTLEDVVPLTEAPPEGTVYWTLSILDVDGVLPLTGVTARLAGPYYAAAGCISTVSTR